MFAGCTFELETTYSESLERYLGQTTGKSTFNVLKVTSKKNPDKVIYLSTGGYLDGTLLPEKDENGELTDSGDGKKNSGLIYTGTAYYLTSSASPTILRCISYAYMNTSTQNITVTGSRYTGMLVRPVYSPNDK